MQEGGAKIVKLECGREQASIVEYLSVRGVPVCAHLGLQPQFVHKLGAFKVQGREDQAAEAMLHDAKVLARSEEHTSELQSLMRLSYAVFCLKTKNLTPHTTTPLFTLAISQTQHINLA